MDMKVVMKLLLLVLFALAIFVPSGTVPSWAYWSLFLLMFAILFLYYRLEYYVSEKRVVELEKDDIRYSCFMAMVPPMASEDLVRGRFVITSTSFKLYQKGSPARLVWSRKISEVSSIETGRVIGVRNGLTFHLNDGNQDAFAVSRHQKIYGEITQILGWESD